jgi:catechol 2,3-dioxygenase-like lactoylglutathione lyase family enzyme
MRLLKNSISVIASLLLLPMLLGATPSQAQLPVPNGTGISTGHAHFVVTNREQHVEIWKTLGGTVGASGSLNYLAFPGIFILLTEGQPTAPSIDTTANHVGFSVQDYAAYKGKLQTIGAKIFYENEKDGQILADLPDGVRIEILTDKTQTQPIIFHHMHVVGADTKALQSWYIKVFGADAGERRGLPSAIIPGGRVDILSVREGAPVPRGSKRGAIDHIGFEVADMDAFAAHLKSVGVAFDVEPRKIEAIGLSIAFLTDPAGTYIEVTQGLSKLK